MASKQSIDGYEAVGDPDGPDAPTDQDTRRQLAAERLRQAVRQQHFHAFTVGEQQGTYYSHSHDGWDEPDHTHSGRQAFPLREDGGYWEESGPSLGTDLPEPVAANIARLRDSLLFSQVAPPHTQMRWRLRLYCGHNVERTAHVDHRTIQAAFSTQVACPECGLDPASIVGARALGVAGSPPDRPARPTDDAQDLRRRLATAEAQVARLRAELKESSRRPPLETH